MYKIPAILYFQLGCKVWLLVASPADNMFQCFEPAANAGTPDMCGWMPAGTSEASAQPLEQVRRLKCFGDCLPLGNIDRIHHDSHSCAKLMAHLLFVKLEDSILCIRGQTQN